MCACFLRAQSRVELHASSQSSRPRVKGDAGSGNEIGVKRASRERNKEILTPGLVVQRVDNAIQQINHYPLDSFVLLTFVHWIAIYPMDSVIHLLCPVA